MRRKMNYPRTEDHRYTEQQQWFDLVAAKLGVVCYRPDYHADDRDANTVMFYTKEDAEHNRKVDRQPTRFTRSEAADRKKFSKIDIPDEYVWRDPFWTFENTDVNGHLDYGFGNFGRLDLRGRDWRERLEGAILLAMARKKQNDYSRACGGVWEIRESDSTYNDLNREIIKYFLMRYGQAFMGNINFYDEKRKKVAQGEDSVYEEYTGQMVYNFGCSFIVPTADEELEKLIRDWNSDDRLPKNIDAVKKITTRVDRIGGVNLIWY